MAMDFQEFISYQEKTFDSYCKKIIKNEYRNAIKECKRLEKHEIVFSALQHTEGTRFSYEDYYELENVTFYITHETITVSDGILAKAISSLPPSWRDIVLLFYFMCQTDRQIGGILGITPNATYYRRKNSIHKLRKAMEVCYKNV